MVEKITLGEWNFNNGYYGYVIQVFLDYDNKTHELNIARLNYPFSHSPYLVIDGKKINLPSIKELKGDIKELKQFAAEKIRNFYGLS